MRVPDGRPCLFQGCVGESGRVISIEAHPTVFRCLSKMCAANRLENVTLVQAAVADHETEVQLTDSHEHEGNSIIGTASGVRVACTTLDSLFRSLGLLRVDLLKMNIEGAERLALAGMREMVKKTKNICISCHDFLADGGGRTNSERSQRSSTFSSRMALSFRFGNPTDGVTSGILYTG